MIVDRNGHTYRVEHRPPVGVEYPDGVRWVDQSPNVYILTNGTAWVPVTDPHVKELVIGEPEPGPEPQAEKPVGRKPSDTQAARQGLLFTVLVDGTVKGWAEQTDTGFVSDWTRQQVSDELHRLDPEVWPTFSDSNDAMRRIPGDNLIRWPGQGGE